MEHMERVASEPVEVWRVFTDGNGGSVSLWNGVDSEWVRVTGKVDLGRLLDALSVGSGIPCGSLDMRQIGELVGLSYRTVRRYRHEGTLPTPAVRDDGKSPRWSVSQILAWDQSRQRKPGPAPTVDTDPETGDQ